MPTKLGQNFLKDSGVVKKIISSAKLNSSDFVIEVGPGEGVLTEELAKCAKKVLAIEIDSILAEKLKLRFENTPNIGVVNADILKINLPEIVQDSQFMVHGYRIIANIPYYITAPIIKLFLETEFPPQEMILMVQKEVAERIVAKPGKMSILAISVQYYAEPSLLFNVSREAFSPVPKVDSAVIRITNNRPLTTDNKEANKQFFRLVRAGFCAKRKTLINNLSSSLKLDKKMIEGKFKKINLSFNVRAQELSLEKWKELLDIL